MTKETNRFREAERVPEDGTPGGGLPYGMRMPREKLHRLIRNTAERAKLRKAVESTALVPKNSEVLIANTNRLTRDMIGLVCSASYGWKVTEAASGREARDLFCARTPLLVILDMGLPEMDWFIPVLEPHSDRKLFIMAMHHGEVRPLEWHSWVAAHAIVKFNIQDEPLERFLGVLNYMSGALLLSSHSWWNPGIHATSQIAHFRSTLVCYRDRMLMPHAPEHPAGPMLSNPARLR